MSGRSHHHRWHHDYHQPASKPGKTLVTEYLHCRLRPPINTRIVEVYRHSGDSVDVGTPLLKLDLQSIENDYRNLLNEEKMKCYQIEQQLINTKTSLSDMALQIRISEMKLNRLLVDYHNEQHLDSLGSGTADQVRQAELAYTTARLELEQLKQRYDTEKAVKAADMKVKQLELEIFRKGMEETRRTLEDARLRSPHKAILTYINTQVGARVAQGEQIAIVADLDHFKIECEIADNYADRIKVGGKALVRINRHILDGIIIQAEPLSKDGVNRFIVQTDDRQNSLLRSGQKADVYVVQTIKEDAVRIKNASFYTGPGSYDLFVEEEKDKLVKRRVNLGECDFDHVEVIEGLKPGDEITVLMRDGKYAVRSGQSFLSLLSDGAKRRENPFTPFRDVYQCGDGGPRGCHRQRGLPPTVGGGAPGSPQSHYV